MGFPKCMKLSCRLTSLLSPIVRKEALLDAGGMCLQFHKVLQVQKTIQIHHCFILAMNQAHSGRPMPSWLKDLWFLPPDFIEIQFCVIFALKDRHFPHKQLLYWWTLENASGGVDNSLHFQEITNINLEKDILENYAYFWRFVESKTMCLMYGSLESWGTYRNFSLIKSTISLLCNLKKKKKGSQVGIHFSANV